MHKKGCGCKENIRLDHRLILEKIEPESRVLDLGCGDGTLLSHLIHEKNCHGTEGIDTRYRYNRKR